MPSVIPPDWNAVLQDALATPSYAELQEFLAHERAEHTVFPPEKDVYNALRYTPISAVHVVILGQDPYHDDGQAHGLSFSVLPGIPLPPSLRNIYRELSDDVLFHTPGHGCLIGWAEQGVLLLNSVLTVRAHQPNSHKNRGWEPFTDAVLAAVSARSEHTVFLLWGAHAQKKLPLLDSERHTVLLSAHPSPLSARSGFFGSKPFSRTNAALTLAGRGVIDWNHLPRPAV